MNYQKIYDQIIERARSENRFKTTKVVYERHHILMKSMGGEDEDENLVYLTFREHFVAHRLLWRIHKNSQSAHAFNMMAGRSKNKNLIISSRVYAEAREAFIKNHIVSQKSIDHLKDPNFIKQRIENLKLRNFKYPEKAKKEISEKNLINVYKCITGEMKKSGGFMWKLKTAELILQKIEPFKSGRGGRRIKKTNSEKKTNSDGF